ncbi:MAG: galactokinase, partial [Rhodospirillaceae bacterium]
MKAFEDIYGSQPEIVAAAPGRVNLLGEHTDYNEGYVLPTAIRQETRVAMRRSPNAYWTVYSAELDETAQFTLAHLPSAHFATYVYGCLREAAAIVAEVPQLDIHIASDVPIGVGLSSSAALEVATLRALRALLDLALDDVRLAQMAQRAEIAYAGVSCGILDQMASSLLEPGSMLFLDTRSLEGKLVPLPHRTEILVIDSGIARSLTSTQYNERRNECQVAARMLGVRTLRDITEETALERLPPTLRKRARHVIRENDRVLRVVAGVAPEQFGALMSASHRSLRDDYDVSIPALDRLVAVLESQE